uniref:Mitochondrial carrier n=1 Tax=Bionectria ochroleuca TaxID=29856 RepID=A0A8H7NC96_BIOOC
MSTAETQHDSTRSSRLFRALAGDAVAGFVSATLISPIVAIIDRSMVEKISINQPLLTGMRRNGIAALTHPARFLFGRPFGLVWALYAGTYVVANGTETLGDEFKMAAVGTVTFFTTMLVNVPLGVWKDVSYARLFAAVDPNKKITSIIPKTPKSVTATFLFRDALTIFGSFTLAPAVSSLIPDHLAANPHTKAVVSQLTVPIFSQLAASPVHLLGLDLYNRQQHIPLLTRASQIRKDLPSVTVLRCLRIIPAFGIGCVANMEARPYFQKLFSDL